LGRGCADHQEAKRQALEYLGFHNAEGFIGETKALLSKGFKLELMAFR
jgi:hypothetical protein